VFFIGEKPGEGRLLLNLAAGRLPDPRHNAGLQVAPAAPAK
jgi:hypothetical protein